MFSHDYVLEAKSVQKSKRSAKRFTFKKAMPEGALTCCQAAFHASSLVAIPGAVVELQQKSFALHSVATYTHVLIKQIGSV